MRQVVLFIFSVSLYSQPLTFVDLRRLNGVTLTPNPFDAVNGAFKVNCVVGCGASGFTDNNPFTAGTTSVNNISGVFNDGIASLTSGNAGAIRSTTDRMLFVNLGRIAGVVPTMTATSIDVNCTGGCGSPPTFTDNSAFTAGTSTISNIGAVFNDGLAAVTSGNAAAPRITSSRAVHFNPRNNAGTEIATATNPFRIDPTGTTPQPVTGTFFQATQPISAVSLPLPTSAAQEHTTAASPHSARLTDGTTFYKATTPSDTQPVSAVSLPLPAGAATSAEQATQTASLSVLDDWDETNRAAVNTIVGQAGVAGGTGVDGATVQRMSLATNVPLPAGTNNIGDVDVLSFPDNEPFNVAQINGVAPLMGAGNTGTGSPRVTQATDQAALPAWGHGATGAAPPTGGTQIMGPGSGATGGQSQPVTVCTEYANIDQTSGEQIITGVSGRRIYVCALNLVTATAQNIAVVAGTGTVCATTTVAVPGTSGGSTAATGWNLAANSGIVIGGGIGAIAKTTVNADNLCILQGGSGQISGGISYAIY